MEAFDRMSSTYSSSFVMFSNKFQLFFSASHIHLLFILECYTNVRKGENKFNHSFFLSDIRNDENSVKVTNIQQLC